MPGFRPQRETKILKTAFQILGPLEAEGQGHGFSFLGLG